jgi:hypothetical protein
VNKAIELIIPVLFVVGAYVALPGAMIAGWVRWAKSGKPRNISAILSLISFIFSTSSGLLAISAALYGVGIGGFRYYDPTLLKIFG